MATVQRDSRRGRGAGARARGIRWSNAALEDANFDFRRADDAQKFHVGLMRKIEVRADLRADLLPGKSGDRKISIVDNNDEMRIAGGDCDARNLKPVDQSNSTRRKRRNAHSGGHFNGEFAIRSQRIDLAYAGSGIGLNAQFISGLEAAFARHPCGHAARAVAADLGDGAVGVMQADAA